jgi:hypothetical protein
MIERAIGIKLQLETLKIRHTNLASYWPTSSEWEKLNSIKELLSEFAMATTELSGQSYPTVAHVRVIFLSLIAYLNTLSDSEECLLNDMILPMKLKLENYWNNIMDDSSKILAFFDPRFKHVCYSGMEINSILEYIRQKLPSIPQTPVQTQIPSQKSRMLHFISRLANNQNISANNNRDEISNYWNFATASTDTSPLDWWKAHEAEYPLLSKLAQDFLSIMATSVPCEQLFSIAGLVITKSRNRLSGNSAREILCLKSWLDEKII